MPLSAPRSMFGIHSITPYDKITKKPFGTMRVLGGSSISLAPELIDLVGGSSRYPWDSEVGTITSEMTITAREYPDWAFELFLGKKPTKTAASSVAVVGLAENVKGTSIINGANGISSVILIPLTGEPNAKFGRYTIVAVSANTFDVYVSTNISFDRGTDANYEDDSLKINSAPLSVAAGDADLASFGLRFEQAGVPAFVVGDSAEFSVDAPSNVGKMEVVVGGAADIFPKFGCFVYAQKKGSGSLFEIDCYNVQAGGLPIGFTEKEWSNAEITAKLLYDSVRNGIMSIRAID